ncbi:MAG: hypothetical protein UHN02_00395, partial [Acutalibacteraceae bacterium]|nr:hypothetical protein [Acutalibacteraceae bacterium]
AAVNSARTQLYGDIAVEDIPIIDIINLGEYGVLNSNDFYFIRNADKINFSIVKHTKTLKGRNNNYVKYGDGIRPKGKGTSRYADNSNEREGIEGENNPSNRNNRPSADKSAFRKNANETQFVEETDRRTGIGNSSSNFGRGVKLSDRDSTTTTRSILANALESVTQNDIEKNKLAEYKEKISQIEAEEQRLSKIQKKLFTKDGVEPSRRKELQFEAKQIANRINTYDRQLLRLEATNPLQNVLNREKTLAIKRQKQKDNEYLKQYKEKVAKTTKELITRNQESRKKAVESRNKTAMRHKIKGLKQKLERMLQNPTDHLYVPQGLAEAIIDVCTLINTDTSIYLKNGEINKAQQKREQTKEKLQALKDEYEKLRSHSDPMYSGEFDDVIYEMLTELRAKYGEKNLSEMSLDELRYLYNEILKPIEETLADARKLIGKGDAADVYEAGYSIIKEQEEITKKRKNGKRNGVAKTKDDMINLSLSPVRNIERMSGYLFNISVLILQKHK